MPTGSSKETFWNASGDEIKPFEEILKPEGWAEENVPFPLLKTGTLHADLQLSPHDGL